MKIVKKKKKRVNKTELVAKEIAAEIKKLGYTVHTKMMASKTAFTVTAPTLYASWKRLAKASLEKEALSFLDSEVSIRVEESSWDKEIRVFLHRSTLLTRILVDRRFKERKEKYLPKVVKKFCEEIKQKKNQKRIVIRGLILSEKQLPASFLGKKAELAQDHTMLMREIRFAKGAGFLEHRFNIEEERAYTQASLSTKSKKDIELFLLEFPKLYKLVERLCVKKARDIHLWYDEYEFNFSKDDEGSMDVSIECTEAADIKAILQTIALFEL